MNRKEIFTLALSFQADINKVDSENMTPLAKAVSLDRKFMAKQLLKMGAKTDIKDSC